MADDTAILVLAANAVDSLLKQSPTRPWVEDFTPVKSWADWDDALTDENVLHVDIVPVGHPTTELDSRTQIRRETEVDIGVRKRFGPDVQDATGRVVFGEVADLVLLVEQIEEHLCTQRLASNEPDIAWESSDVRASFIRKHLRENRQFTGIVRVTFDSNKTIGEVTT